MSNAVCYRLRRYYFRVGVTLSILFAAMTVFSVAVAYANADGSFPHPWQAAFALGMFWGSWTLLSLWLMAAAQRERLWVSDTTIINRGLFRTTELPLASVVAIRWRTMPRRGSIVVRGPTTKIVVYLNNYHTGEQSDLVAFFKAKSGVAHEGWEKFAAARSRPRPGPQPARILAVVCSALLFGNGGLLIGCWEAGLGVGSLALGMFNVLGGCLYLWRLSRFRRAFPSAAG